MRGIFIVLLLCAAVAGLMLNLWFGGNFSRDERPPRTVAARTASQLGTLTPRQTWGNVSTLPDHFARHGADFGARTADEYALMARQFLVRAQTEGLSAKVDRSGVLRVYDQKSGAFAAYNRDLTTKTFFKPGQSGYFERQPGQSVDLRTWK